MLITVGTRGESERISGQLNNGLTTIAHAAGLPLLDTRQDASGPAWVVSQQMLCSTGNSQARAGKLGVVPGVCALLLSCAAIASPPVVLKSPYTESAALAHRFQRVSRHG